MPQRNHDRGPAAGSGGHPSASISAWSREWSGARRLLAVRLDAVGDVLMTTPAIRALSEGGRRIDLLTSPAGARIAELVPEVDRAVPFEAPWMKASPPRGAHADEAIVRELRAGGYDGAVIFTVFSQSPLPAAYLCHLAGIPRGLAHVRENPYQLVSHWVPEPEIERPERHEVRRQLDLVATIGSGTEDLRLSLRVPGSARARLRSLLGELDPNRPWAVIHPGASAPARRYPWEGFAEAARLLAQGHGWQLVFSGTSEERDLVDRIRAVVGRETLSLAGRLDVQTLAALVEAAPLLISNNTGPVHMAAALGTPVVDVYALTNDQHMPWMVESRVLFHDVPCRNCLKSVCPEGHHNCLRLVAPQRVAEAATSLMDEASRRFSAPGPGAPVPPPAG